MGDTLASLLFCQNQFIFGRFGNTHNTTKSTRKKRTNYSFRFCHLCGLSLEMLPESSSCCKNDRNFVGFAAVHSDFSVGGPKRAFLALFWDLVEGWKGEKAVASQLAASSVSSILPTSPPSTGIIVHHSFHKCYIVCLRLNFECLHNYFDLKIVFWKFSWNPSKI